MKKAIPMLFIVTLLSFSTQSFAEWSYSHVPFVGKWVVTNGEKTIELETEKGAKKAARALNKNDKKVAKQESGVWNDGSDYCANPLNEC